MLLGQSPFRGDDEDEIFDAILEDEPLYPITMPRDAVSVLQKVTMQLLAFVLLYTYVSQASQSGPHTPLGFWKRRRGGNQETPLFQGCELR